MGDFRPADLVIGAWVLIILWGTVDIDKRFDRLEGICQASKAVP